MQTGAKCHQVGNTTQIMRTEIAPDPTHYTCDDPQPDAGQTLKPSPSSVSQRGRRLSFMLGSPLCSIALRLAASSAFCCWAMARCSSRSCFMTLARCSASLAADSSTGLAAGARLRSLRKCLLTCFCFSASSVSCLNLAASAVKQGAKSRVK